MPAARSGRPARTSPGCRPTSPGSSSSSAPQRTPEERLELQDQAQRLRDQIRALGDQRQATQETLATTPMVFNYGSGDLVPGYRPPESLGEALGEAWSDFKDGATVLLAALIRAGALADHHPDHRPDRALRAAALVPEEGSGSRAGARGGARRGLISLPSLSSPGEGTGGGRGRLCPEPRRDAASRPPPNLPDRNGRKPGDSAYNCLLNRLIKEET